MKAHKLRDPPVKCNKCGAHFGNNTALELHAKDNLCSPKPRAVGSVYTPGITELMEFKLRDRRVKSQVRTWEALWATIFPDHPSVPPPCQGQGQRL
ncbi:hypothetical protein FALBO_5257 [Fusarium albosuccineum]|uniref:C2H2-type domain-containing protein n=1 Tax=Fusarium albosuccineum TaxID=1237068 RepID=A0A8H4LGD8_9HYPO|nr:hypothetical protein FALBO_5257 [Fusarium albosuccineum]